MNYSNFLKSHVISEAYSGLKFPINEEDGAVPNLRAYLDVVRERFNVEVYMKPKADFYRYTMTEDDFKEVDNKFFTNIDVEITAVIGNTLDDDLYKKETGCDKEAMRVGDKETYVRIVIYNEGLSYLKMRDKICSDFGHELTHAYQEVIEARDGHPIQGSPRDNAYKAIRDYKSVDVVARNLKNVMYFINSFERNAFIGQCRADIDNIRDEITNVKTVMGLPMRLPLYKDFVNAENFLNDVIECGYASDIRTLINTFNELSPKYKVNTLNQLIKKLSDVISKYYEKYEKHVIAMGMEVYKENESKVRGNVKLDYDFLTEEYIMFDDGHVLKNTWKDKVYGVRECMKRIEGIRKRKWSRLD